MTVQKEQVQIVCAGLPRSGTTMLYRALAGLPPGSKTPKPQTGPVRKTHSFEPKNFIGIKAAVFVFGDPVASVISTRLNRWDRGHFVNCGAGHRDPETTDIFREDALSYERMFDAWMQRQAFDLIAVRYETMHDYTATISELLGQPLVLPARNLRRTFTNTVCPDDLEAIKITYGSLSEKILKAGDLTIWQNQS